jgi:hypothetical protein
VRSGLIDEVGGLGEAIATLQHMISSRKGDPEDAAVDTATH